LIKPLPSQLLHFAFFLPPLDCMAVSRFLGRCLRLGVGESHGHQLAVSSTWRNSDRRRQFCATSMTNEPAQLISAKARKNIA
jgi:hypothetical protein